MAESLPEKKIGRISPIPDPFTDPFGGKQVMKKRQEGR
jgi:hypothetical protein